MSRVPAGRSVEVRVPASSANLGPGFDSIGLALGLWDHYVVSVTETPGLVIEVSGEGADDVPTDERHLVHATMRHTWGVLGCEPPVGLRITACNGVPHGRGLGLGHRHRGGGPCGTGLTTLGCRLRRSRRARRGRPGLGDAHRECARGTPRQCVSKRPRWAHGAGWMPDGTASTVATGP